MLYLLGVSGDLISFRAGILTTLSSALVITTKELE